MEIAELEHLGYPRSGIRNYYFTAMPAPGVGVCVVAMHSYAFVQFFPWDFMIDTGEQCTGEATGHERYANFIQAKATTMMAERQELFAKWPHYHVHLDLLLIKCAIEDGLKQMGHMDDATNQSS